MAYETPTTRQCDQPPVVILCGGLGTRLREETEFRPKPMVPIGDRPILWHIMKIYSHYGFHEFILALGYKGEVIRDYFINYDVMHSDVRVRLGPKTIEILDDGVEERDWEIILVDTGAASMTGGRLRALRSYIGDRTFMVTYGDGVANINIRKLVEFHHVAGKLATVTAVHPASRFGELQVHGDLALSFQEKPQTNQGWINGGFFVFEPEVLDRISSAETSLEAEPLEALAQDCELAVYRHHGYWQCMDTPRDMQNLNEIWRRGDAPWCVWKHAHAS